MQKKEPLDRITRKKDSRLHLQLIRRPLPLSPFLTCCEILPTSFGGEGPHLRR